MTSLLIVITVPKTLTVYQPTSSTNFWGSTVNNIINETDTDIMYIFQLINGKTIVAGSWQIIDQFSLNNEVRPTINDTYIIQIQSYQNISGHF